ncbi:MAG: sigma-70 family RNA polymerase sigma factor [Myxococcales bacterium]|nr:sigma-70 family RNA polymerase sigma factor [Myxococcales bacterium]
MNEKADQGQTRTGRREASKELTFRAEVQPHLGALRRQVARLVPVEASEDIVQESLMAAWRHAHTLPHIEKMGPWLMSIARRKAIDWLRREGRSVPCEPLEATESFAASQRSPEGELTHRQGLALVHDAVAALPPRQQAVIDLRAFEEEDVHHTATLLSMAEKTVYATESSARESLKRSSLMREAWSMLSAVGTVLWMLCTRSKQLLAQSVGWIKTTAQAGVLVKNSTVLWTGTAGIASLAGMVALGPRPDVSEGLSRKLSISSKGTTLALNNVDPKSSDTSLFVAPVASRSQRFFPMEKRKPQKKQNASKPFAAFEGIKTMKMQNTIAMAAMAAGLLLSTPAQAGDKTNKTTVVVKKGQDLLRYRKVTKLDFTGSTLRGNVEKPVMMLLQGRRRVKLKSLITVRKNFRERMAATAAGL